MEQAARICGVGLVSYAMTHHTRQSAVGLPQLVQHKYGEKSCTVTEYTMSEIVASIYDYMEATGFREGILFLDEIHTMIGAGGAEGAIDASSILKPSLSRAELQLIGATTIAEYRKYIEKDAALERRFQPVSVEEPTQEQCRKILEGLKEKYETHHKVVIEEKALEAAVLMSERYITDRHLPDKAIDVLDEACSKVSL